MATSLQKLLILFSLKKVVILHFLAAYDSNFILTKCQTEIVVSSIFN